MAKLKEFTVENWKELMEALYHGDYAADLKRHRSPFVYRGLLDSDFTLSTSLYRHSRGKLEGHFLRNFKKYSQLTGPPMSDWLWLALAQHHGLPTRLLDWTYSPMVALHFATADHLTFQKDSVIWAINYRDTRKYLPEHVKKAMEEEKVNILSIDILERVATGLNDYCRGVEKPFATFFEPPSLDGRIVSQFGVFSFMSKPDVEMDAWLEEFDIECFKIKIPSCLLWQIRDRLDQANINERTLFPGLDGLASWLRRNYLDRSNEDHPGAKPGPLTAPAQAEQAAAAAAAPASSPAATPAGNPN